MPKEKKTYQGPNHQGVDRSAPYPVSRLAPSFDLVDLAKEIAHADDQISLQVNGKLGVIAEQIKELQNQAREILEHAQHDQSLHRAKCHFSRKPGNFYHLFEKPDKTLYFSMLSPEEWGKRCNDKFVGTYRLELDMSWTNINDIKQKSNLPNLIDQFIKP